MNPKLNATIDKIIANEFNDDNYLYTFEKEQLFETLRQKKEILKLNEMGVDISDIPYYVLTVTSIINLYLRYKQYRKKITEQDIKNEMQKNSLPNDIIIVLLKKYAEHLIEQINNDDTTSNK